MPPADRRVHQLPRCPPASLNLPAIRSTSAHHFNSPLAPILQMRLVITVTAATCLTLSEGTRRSRYSARQLAFINAVWRARSTHCFEVDSCRHSSLQTHATLFDFLGKRPSRIVFARRPRLIAAHAATAARAPAVAGVSISSSAVPLVFSSTLPRAPASAAAARFPSNTSGTSSKRSFSSTMEAIQSAAAAAAPALVRPGLATRSLARTIASASSGSSASSSAVNQVGDSTSKVARQKDMSNASSLAISRRYE